MKTLIIPCVGRSITDGKVKYLLTHPDGKLLIEKCYDGIKKLEFERVIVTILEDDNKNYSASYILNEVFSNVSAFELCILESSTSGPAETIYQTIQKMNIQGSIVIKDSNNYIQVDSCNYTNFVAGLNLINYQEDIMNIRNKSFIIANEQNHILDIVEKQIKSDIICLGLYGIKNASDFIEAYESISDKNYGIEGLYVSHIISYLIGRRGYIYHYINATNYENWGTDKEWDIIRKKYATYFINFESVLYNDKLIDFDYVANNDVQLNSLIIENIRILAERGAKIVITTSYSDEFKMKIFDLMNDVGINPLEIICNCSYSIREVVNDENRLRSCVVAAM